MSRTGPTVKAYGITYRTFRGCLLIPQAFLKEETRRIARTAGPVLLATGEKVMYKHGVGYVYTHKYSDRAEQETLERLAAGERL